MNTQSHTLPRIVIRSIAGGLFLMAFFTMMWTGIAQGGLLGQDHRIVLIAFAAICLVFIIAGIRLFLISGKFPKFTTDADKAEGKKMGRAFGIIFGIEGLAIPVASVILVLLGHDRYILPAIALIVGLHFYPMARIFQRQIDYYIATWTCLISLISMTMIAGDSRSEPFILAFLGIGVALATTTYGIYMLASGRQLLKKFRPILLLLLIITTGLASSAQKKTIAQRVDSVLRLMTLGEKIGQMNQYSGNWAQTGPITGDDNKLQEIREGKLGSMLNINGVAHTREIQEIAMHSRLKIPLLFGQDVIHGYRTTFPVPLAEAASWDLEAIERSARIAATEAAAGGIHWIFAPMVDIARDPRWGRIMEGAGEDPYLGSAIARARVKGFQGKGPGNTDAVLACVKHFAAYGAAIGGRDYNSVDISDRTLWEVYLPPFKAAAEAGAATFMNSFNDLNGIPASANGYLQTTILKGKWKFSGFIVSDWGSIGEMINHGFVKDSYEAALAAVTAGNDMDMESRSYIGSLARLVKEGKVSMQRIDGSVRRILTKKFEMGLFDDPFRYCNEQREQQALNDPEHRRMARSMADKSIVLLKNEHNLLPLSKEIKKIAVIGPLARSKMQMLGFWATEWPDSNYIVSPLEGITARLGGSADIVYAKGCDIEDSSRNGFAEAISAAGQSDVVIMTVGERRDMTGEAKSRADLHLPGVQEELIQAICKTGKPIVVLISSGRPLIFNWTADHVPAILYTWWLGDEAGNAMADVLSGDYNPSAKLPVSFPRAEGQIPIYYAHMSTGRPALSDSDRFYRSSYTDLSLYPRYAFGYGLSYTSFRYSDLKLSSLRMKTDQTITVSLTLTNTGIYAGEEVVQCYLRDEVASLVRPVKELKDFVKIGLQPGESRVVRFTIGREKLSFYNQQLQWVAEPGVFDLMIGSASDDIRLQSKFELVK
ncbi:MAG TPA: beta-glucosidase BglX [Puia sp.]|nr:beta-glucosidase BglX [Puia sp.]